MQRTFSSRTTAHRPLATALVLVVLVTILTGVVWHPAGSPLGVISHVLWRDDSAAGAADTNVTQADGVLPDGATVFDDDYPGVAGLDPELAHALRAAATDATTDGIELHVNSGWRSPEYQERLLLEAVDEYGSRQEAARWVATPDRSAHVTGDAVDVGPPDAAAWLAQQGAAYGLCQTYGNEPWHYELRPEAINGACPPIHTDPTTDPRMQQ